jgi:hypothetical protein
MSGIIYKAIFDPLSIFNQKQLRGTFFSSVIIVAITALAGSVIGPAASYYANKTMYKAAFNFSQMFLSTAVSILTPFIAYMFFYLMAKALKKKITFKNVISVWGLSYIPNFLCIVLYFLLIIFPGILTGSAFSAFIIGTFFIAFLVWKAILYFMFLKCVLDVTVKQFIIFTAAAAILFALLMMVGIKAGVQVPML